MAEDEQWYLAGQSEDFVEGQGKEVFLQGRIVAVFRFQGSVYALDGICPHQGGPLAEGQVASGCVTCPWHGWQYELATGTHTISGRRLAESLPIRETDQKVFVKIVEN